MCVLYYFVSWIGNIIELEQCHDHWIGSFVSHSDSNVNEYSGELNVKLKLKAQCICAIAGAQWSTM